MILTHIETIEKRIDFTKDTFKRALYYEGQQSTKRVLQRKAMALLSSIVRSNRVSIFGTSNGYSIVLNGFGAFKAIKVHGCLSTAGTYSRDFVIETIFNKGLN